jgi:hypothetical protein
MSAAATAAGYLYASGRLRGKNAHENEHKPDEKKPRKARVAVLPPEEHVEKPRKTPKIQYRTRRWKPDDHA